MFSNLKPLLFRPNDSSKLAPYESDDTYNPFEHRVIDKPNT